jgi:hypothetical protein
MLEFLVAATMCETYLLHSDTPFVSGRSKDDILSNCGNIKKLVKECGPPVHLIIGALSDEEAITERSRKVTRLLIMQNNLLVREVTDLILNCDPDVFFKTLMNNLRNEVCSHQTFMRKAKFKKIESTKNKLEELKKDYIANSVRIQETEQILNNLIDMEMRSELFKYKHFDILNAEKISPRFLSLAKIKAKEVPLSTIKDDNGMNFLRDSDRNDYIANFYAGIYKTTVHGDWSRTPSAAS